MEELIKRQILTLEISKHTSISLSQKYYYDMFCKDIVRYIKHIANTYLEPYNHNFIKRVAIGSYKDLYAETLYDITDDVLINTETVNKEMMEVSTIPHIFEIVDIVVLFDKVKKAIESVLIGVYIVSIYFDFFIFNEATMIFKCEIYKCQ